MIRKRKANKTETPVATSGSRNAAVKGRRKARASRANADMIQEVIKEDLSASISIQEKVALLAYRYWEERGRPGGSPEEDWYRAEKEILGQMGISDQ